MLFTEVKTSLIRDNSIIVAQSPVHISPNPHNSKDDDNNPSRSHRRADSPRCAETDLLCNLDQRSTAKPIHSCQHFVSTPGWTRRETRDRASWHQVSSHTSPASRDCGLNGLYLLRHPRRTSQHRMRSSSYKGLRRLPPHRSESNHSRLLHHQETHRDGRARSKMAYKKPQVT